MGFENAWVVRMFVSRVLTALPVAALLSSLGCSAETGQSSAPENVGILRAAVKDGFALYGHDADDWNGMVRIWAKNTQFDEVHQFCGGVLITNKLVATAAHCLKLKPEDIAYGWPDVSSDTSALTISSSALNIIADGVGAPYWARSRGVQDLARPASQVAGRDRTQRLLPQSC